MLFRLFLAFAVCVCGFFIYDVYRAMAAYERLSDFDESRFFTQDDADLQMVEFLDYSCPACQQMHPLVKAAVLEDGRVRYTVRPLHSGYKGEDAARLVYAAGLQGRYMAAHDYIVQNGYVIDEAFIEKMALSLSLDSAQLKADMQSRAAYKALKWNAQDFRALGGVALPAFILGPDVLFYADERVQNTQALVTIFRDARRYYAGADP